MSPGGPTSIAGASVGGRLGDLVRVIAALGPLTDTELALLADFIPPDDQRAGPRDGVPRPQPAARAAALAPLDQAGPSRAEGGRARRHDRAWRRRGRRSVDRLRRWRPWRGPALRQAKTRLVLGALAGASSLAAIAGLLLGGFRAALAIALVAVPMAVLAAALAPALRTWWRSPLRRASSKYQPAVVPGADRAPGAGAAAPLELTRTRWEAPPPAAPLAASNQMRALAVALAASSVEGRIDVTALVSGLARRRPPGRRAPRVTRWSVRNGVQLVVDRSAALEPFRGDAAGVRRALRAVASASGLQELGFEADPEVVTWPLRLAGRSGRPYRGLVPRKPIAVVVVTDLGIGQARAGSLPPAPGVWLRHHEQLRQAGCRPLYLVPYPASRWPPDLRGHLPIVEWTDGLRPGEVARRAREPGRP